MAVLKLDELQAATSAQAETLGKAIRRLQSKGKRAIAYGKYYSQAQYLIASYADEIYMHPMGQVLLQGYGGNRLYYHF